MEAGMGNFPRLAVVAVILALGMVLSSALLSKLFVRIRREQAITVKGYAEKDLVSDVGRFTCAYSARGSSLREAYDRLQEARMVVLEYVRARGFGDGDIATGTIETSKVAKRDVHGGEMNEVEYYDVAQAITVTSSNVTMVRDVANSITELIKEGIDVSACSREFYVSDLKDTKLELLAKATEDGYRRAVALAANSRGKVGALISAQQGVFQITRRNSTDTSGYGEYNTSAIEKTAKAVVTLEYAIEAER
jgi:hypothetical protein